MQLSISASVLAINSIGRSAGFCEYITATEERELAGHRTRPARLMQDLLERGEAGLTIWIVRGRVHEHADSPLTSSLLRARSERPRRRAAEQRDELASLHLRGHSITSSARASTVGGSSRPSALAFFKFITSSSLVGC